MSASLQEPEPTPRRCLLPVPPQGRCTPPPCSGKWICTNEYHYVYDCAGEVGPEAAARRPSRGAHQCGVPSHCLLQAGQQDPCSKQVRQASHPLLAALSPKIMFVTYCVCVWYVMAKMISLRTLHVGNMWFSHDQFLVLMLIIGGIVFFS